VPHPRIFSADVPPTLAARFDEFVQAQGSNRNREIIKLIREAVERHTEAQAALVAFQLEHLTDECEGRIDDDETEAA
jgi:metal-responsive CopG/Arc/MetJ family transcriptional regulator